MTSATSGDARPSGYANGDESLRLEDFLPYRLSVLSNLVSSAIAGAYSEQFGLTIQEWRVIAILARYPDISAKQVTEKGAMDKVQVSRAVRRLLSEGLIEREKDKSDRRASCLRLSAAGWRIYERIIPLAQRYEEDLVEVLDAGERQHLDRLLQKLHAKARAWHP